MAWQASGVDVEDPMPASPQCRALISQAVQDDADRERQTKEEYYRTLPNLWDPKQAAAVLKAEKPKEVISRADNTKEDFPPGTEGMKGRAYTDVSHRRIPSHSKQLLRTGARQHVCICIRHIFSSDLYD